MLMHVIIHIIQMLKDDISPISTLYSENIEIYRERSTDILYIAYIRGGITELKNPENGLPMTYEYWKDHYH